jgi:hypothetical protein
MVATPNTPKNLWLLFLPISWNQRGHGFADDLIRLVPIKSFGTFVPGGDGPMEVDAQDGVIGRLDDRCQSLGMTLPKRLNGGTDPVLQPLRQAAQNARPLRSGAFGVAGI